jgi:hypothetical protein
MRILQVISVVLCIALKSASSFAAAISLAPGELGSGQIFTPCIFDGNAQNCLLDSGADATHITATAAFSDYPSLGKVGQSGAGGSAQVCDWILLHDLVTADVKLNQHQAIRCPGTAANGIVGIDVFQGKTLRLDFQTLSLEATDAPIPTSLTRNSFTLSPAGLINLPIKVANTDQTAIWDTGAGLTSVDLNFAKAHPEWFTFIRNLDGGHDSTGHTVTLALYQLSLLSVANKTFASLDVLGFDFGAIRVGAGPSPQLILGYNVIAKTNWYIDLRTRTWSVN